MDKIKVKTIDTTGMALAIKDSHWVVGEWNFGSCQKETWWYRNEEHWITTWVKFNKTIKTNEFGSKQTIVYQDYSLEWNVQNSHWIKIT